MHALIALCIIVVVAAAAPCDCAMSGKLIVSEDKCTCGVFATDKAEGVPFIVKTPGIKLDCKKDGTETCKKLCVALAEASKNDAPKIFCDSVKELPSGVKPAVHSKACGAADFAYTGLTAQDAICCTNGKSVPCTEAAKLSKRQVELAPTPEVNVEAGQQEGEEIVEEAEKESVQEVAAEQEEEQQAVENKEVQQEVKNEGEHKEGCNKGNKKLDEQK